MADQGTGIQEAKSAIWNNETMTAICRTLRKYKYLEVVRNHSQQTVIVRSLKRTATLVEGQEMLRALRGPQGWITRFDSRLIKKREG